MKITVGLNEGFSFYLYLRAIKMDFAGNVMSFLVHMSFVHRKGLSFKFENVQYSCNFVCVYIIFLTT